MNWLEHVAKWKDCTLCPLHQQRTNIVLARGTVPCDVLFIGEAPGASEDALAQPFKGPAGHRLDQIVLRAIPPTVNCAYCNLVACFPRDAKARGENEPEIAEIKACRPRLVEFVRIAQPKLVVLVGNLASSYVTGAAMFRLDGKAAQPEWIPDGDYLRFCEIIHPAATLGDRMAAAKKQSVIQHTIVILRNAVEDMLQLTPDERGAYRGSIAPPQEDIYEDDIPF